MKKVAVLVSGSGSNLQALIDADIPIGLVVSNKVDAYALERAKKAGIATAVIAHKDYDSRDAFDTAMTSALEQHSIDFVCLAGFMRLLTPGFVQHWHNRLINIHPSLLPSFKGLNTHQRAIDTGVRFTGCTVHFVREEMDVGPIIIQAAVPVMQDDTAETLGIRVLEAEHKCYPAAVKMVLEGKAQVKKEQVIITTNILPNTNIHPIQQ